MLPTWFVDLLKCGLLYAFGSFAFLVFMVVVDLVVNRDRNREGD